MRESFEDLKAKAIVEFLKSDRGKKEMKEHGVFIQKTTDGNSPEFYFAYNNYMYLGH